MYSVRDSIPTYSDGGTYHHIYEHMLHLHGTQHMTQCHNKLKQSPHMSHNTHYRTIVVYRSHATQHTQRYLTDTQHTMPLPKVVLITCHNTQSNANLKQYLIKCFTNQVWISI